MENISSIRNFESVNMLCVSEQSCYVYAARFSLPSIFRINLSKQKQSLKM